MQIRLFEVTDFVTVQDIYQQGIDSKNATFQLARKNWQQWQESMLQDSVLVMCDLDKVVGWAGLSSVSSRAVYRGVGEVSIYVAKESAGEGVGSQLMLSLITRSELLGFWALQATIFPENSASMALHSKYKFRRVGQRNALGKMHGKWRDVELLERRSESVGTD